ncbi:hypothetical protein GLOIN_2v1717333 [Rhizophagus clarus]|uniref:Peptidase A2 domain-containing protein n=1 Tax=Rhizophagus clarus TaxID=94130 RepID=A0A8H3M7B1_9GLOM|nr:hypothetical protein GLOIN_2v1717333 [Rhizophagus clarus]
MISIDSSFSEEEAKFLMSSKLIPVPDSIRHNFVAERGLELSETAIKILEKEEIKGQDFFDLTQEELEKWGMPEKYDLASEGTEIIPLFTPRIHEIPDENKHLELCMADIKLRLKSYGTLVMTSLESMRNEYVSTILHTALRIAEDITKKKFSMRPEYEIIEDESSGRVDYAIKESEDLICITEDKVQQKLTEGFAQNIKQLESSFQTNKRKRKRDEDYFDYLIEFVEEALVENSEEYKTLRKGVKKVLGIIIGLLEDRACPALAPSADVIEELRKNNTKENTELRDRVTKVEEKQILNDNSSNLSSSNFNLVADQVPMVMHHEKSSVDTSLPEDKETDAFLNEVHKKKGSDEIRQRRRKEKLQHESIAQDLMIASISEKDDRAISEISGKFEKTVPSGTSRISEVKQKSNENFKTDQIYHYRKVKANMSKFFKLPKIQKILKKKKTPSVEMSTDRVKIRNIVPESELEKKYAKSSDLGKQRCTVSETTNIEDFAIKLGLDNFTKNKEEWKKFYEFAGPNFIWPQPPTDINGRRLVYDYVIDPYWEPIGSELAKNALEYRRLLDSKSLDQSREYVLIANGKFVQYGSSEEKEKMKEDYPGCYYVPVKERVVELRKFSASDANTNAGAKKEWQVHIRLRNTDDNLDEAGMANVEHGFRMIIDTGATTIVIPDFVRKKLNDKDGWELNPSKTIGYGAGANMFKASKEWDICLGDGTNWSGWITTKEIHSWQSNPSGVNCGLIGYDVLNNIPHYKPCRQPYIFLQNDIFNQIQELQQSE